MEASAKFADVSILMRKIGFVFVLLRGLLCGSEVFHLANALDIDVRQIYSFCCLNRLESKIYW